MTDSLKSKTHTADPVVLIKTCTVPAEEDREWPAALKRLFDDPGLHITSEPAGYRVVVEFRSS
ncbi:hypothetical protein [Streptomyces violaceorubidus]|uniref:Uncharacterized protein n=1 Tax=Streptomyces violaceorubidus TaxID=284042 RepID=A0ABV1T5E0_9ACTN